MNLSRCTILLQLTSMLALGPLFSQSKSLSLPNEPVALVQSLYAQVVARHPLGIPSGADEKIFSPYFSKALQHKVDLFLACNSDWFRQHPDPNLKGPSGLWESGIFSGPDEQAEPRDFHIERTQSEPDGSVRVYLRLIVGTPPERPWIWHVAAVVVREDDHFALDDVIYLKDPEHRGPEDVDSRLSKRLSAGCDGPHWVGFASQPRTPRRPR